MIKLVPTEHALRTILAKGFDADDILAVVRRPERRTRVTKYPGQVRLIGRGLALVGYHEGREFHLITVYADEVLTPPRPDQLDTPEGRRYAARWAAGEGRG